MTLLNLGSLGMQGRSVWIRLAALAVVLQLSVASADEGADRIYENARGSYSALKHDAARRKLRHHWLRVARLFQKVEDDYPRSDRAPEALFTSAQLLEDLSRISLLAEDRDAAAQGYRKLIERHPRHKLADDAALALAKLQLERMGRPDQARHTLQNALHRLPHGDRSKEMLALLTSLPSAITPAPVRAPVVRRPDSPPVRPVPTTASPLPHVHEPSEASEPTVAEQLGLKMRRIVIDAGHGGHDGGAVGPNGTQEKDVSLAIAERLAKTLGAGGMETVLTREDDTFVPLEERTRRANAAKGDLFVSIHCNAAVNPKLQGVETYTLNLSSNRYAIRLAARENASSEKGMSALQFILADLATQVNTHESRRLASKLQSQLVQDLGEKREARDLGTKEALFYVLLGAKMPAVLVETSFLSNPEEEALLASPAYQKKVARSIADGIRAFLGDRERIAQMN